MNTLCTASEIKEGEFFSKKTGTVVYLRISVSAIKFLQLNPALVYGVCYNGNVTIIKRDTVVKKRVLSDFSNNIQRDKEWEKAMGVKL